MTTPKTARERAEEIYDGDFKEKNSRIEAREALAAIEKLEDE